MPDDADLRPLPPRAARPLRRVARIVRHFGARHRGTFIKGCLAALVTVGARLATPWPAHALMAYWKLGVPGAPPVPAELMGLDRPLALGLAFLLLLATLGLADAVLRVQFARFSIGTMRDMRSAAVAAATRMASTRAVRAGDLVARLVGDTARVKAGLKGFLVHVAPSSMLFLGVSVILLTLSVRLGLVFLAAGLLTAALTAFGARAMYRRSKKYRRKEGKLADHLDGTLRGDTDSGPLEAANRSSGRHEASLTRIQSLTTWGTYIIYGSGVLVAIGIGSREIALGVLEPRDMVLFLMYALILRGPTVRLARQGSRLGKTVATATRVVKILYRTPDDTTEDSEIAPVPVTETASS